MALTRGACGDKCIGLGDMSLAVQIVFGTSSGHIYVVSGTTGADVKGFPFRTHGR